MKSVLICVCGRAGSKGVKSKNLRMFCERPIVYYSLSAADMFIKARPDLDIDVCLDTDSDDLAKTVLERYPEAELIRRAPELCGDDVQKESVYRECVSVMEKRKNKRYDCLIDLDITSPLRRFSDVTGIFETFEKDENADVVLSAAPARRNPYYNQGQRGEDGYARRVIENRNTARQQAPECYDFNASLYVFDRDFLIERMTFDLWQGRCLAYMMYDTGILDIDSETDYELLQVIGGYLFKNVPEFAAVRDNIR